MIRSFRHAGLEQFFLTGSKAGIQPKHAARLSRQLAFLNAAAEPASMNVPGWKLHELKGALAGTWSVWVNGNWRLTFRFENSEAILVNYADYH